MQLVADTIKSTLFYLLFVSVALALFNLLNIGLDGESSPIPLALVFQGCLLGPMLVFRKTESGKSTFGWLTLAIAIIATSPFAYLLNNYWPEKLVRPSSVFGAVCVTFGILTALQISLLNWPEEKKTTLECRS